jgi:hypothetical protein
VRMNHVKKGSHLLFGWQLRGEIQFVKTYTQWLQRVVCDAWHTCLFYCDTVVRYSCTYCTRVHTYIQVRVRACDKWRKLVDLYVRDVIYNQFQQCVLYQVRVRSMTPKHTFWPQCLHRFTDRKIDTKSGYTK